MKRKLPEVTRNVEEILKDYPPARNSDKYLVAVYMSKYHGIRTFLQAEKDLTTPSYESIRRARQKIQACGQYLPAEKIKGCRRENEVIYSNYFGE